MKLIDADEVLKIVKHFGLSNPALIGRHSGIADIIYDRIEGLPIIEAAEPVRHGKWRGYTRVAFHGMDNDNPIYRDTIVWHCSCCGRRTVIRENYCPNCGAKMDLEDEENG